MTRSLAACAVQARVSFVACDLAAPRTNVVYARLQWSRLLPESPRFFRRAPGLSQAAIGS